MYGTCMVKKKTSIQDELYMLFLSKTVEVNFKFSFTQIVGKINSIQ